MSFNFIDLNKETRAKMLSEIQYDISRKKLYFSKRFSQIGVNDYPELLIQHVENGNEVTLGDELKENGRFNELETTARGVKKVPFDAHETFSQGEFNRFYARALCLIAIDTEKQLEVFRAKESIGARSASQQKIGEKVNPQNLLTDLRNNTGIDTALGLPAGPNSGLSVKLI